MVGDMVTRLDFPLLVGRSMSSLEAAVGRLVRRASEDFLIYKTANTCYFSCCNTAAYIVWGGVVWRTV